MTEKLPPLSTQIVPPSQGAVALTSIVSSHDVAHQVEVVEEEPYTIKCICTFSDDDGNTIYCDTCDTWQHIKCFYPNNVQDAYREDFAHSCAECNPRPLDRQRAYERQLSRLNSLPVVAEAMDKKAKRPPSKSHKKKPKPTDLQLNGLPPADSTTTTTTTKNNLAHDHAPTKKAKSSHKPSHSVSSQAAKRSPPYGAGRNSISHCHPPSPATTPPDLPQDFEVHNYSSGFLALNNNQNDFQIVQTNSFASLNISNTMSLWLREPGKLRQETGQSYGDVFQDLPPNIESLRRPLALESKILSLDSDTVVRWQYLTTPTAVEKDVPLIELNGLIGFQKDYSADKNNRWEEFSSPLPFVFFHEQLPLCIDTRREGSRARFVRRSCKPNSVIDTFLSGGSEYHFWLVSDRHIAAHEQVTIAWDFRFPKKQKARMLRLLGLGDDDHGSHEEEELDESEYQTLTSWLHLILSEYGGCACELGSNCAFVRFHRNHHAKLQPRNTTTTKKKSRKPKAHTISPTSTGQATNSRAASEGRLDDCPEADAGSASGSSRSKPPSRDMTPAPRQGSFDTLGILTEPTDRDKRKVAMVEDSFRRMEQQHQPVRKKKRVSDGTTSSNSSSKPKSKGATGPGSGSHYVDAGTSRSKSCSPSSTTSPNMPSNPFQDPSSRHTSVAAPSRNISLRGNYCDASVQTDPVEGEWYSEPGQPSKPRRVVVPLSKRLLENRYRIRQEEAGRRKHRESLDSNSGAFDAMVIDPTAPGSILSSASPKAAEGSAPTSVPQTGSADTPMPDAPVSPDTMKPPPPLLITEPLPGPPSGFIKKSPDLRVQMPPVPAFNGPPSAISTATTPLSAAGSMVQSPFSTTTLTSPFHAGPTNGIGATPSPVKKKLSLSDYTKSRKAAASRPSVGTTLKASTFNADEPRSATSVDGPSISDSPLTEKAATDPMTPILEPPFNGTAS